jgi:hypothetical protein
VGTHEIGLRTPPLLRLLLLVLSFMDASSGRLESAV